MQQTITLRVRPEEASASEQLQQLIARSLGKNPDAVSGYTILKSSIDARGRQPFIQLSLLVYIDEPAQQREVIRSVYKDVHSASKKVIIVGAGPAGLFAALQLLEQGIKPLVLERGKDVRTRRRDLAAINKQGIMNPESNYCFGEGGAGTYSDGKLYTRSNKRGDINKILNTFVRFGAEEKILYQAHPHIGTNKLPQIITGMREQILACGGEVRFNKKVTGLITDNGVLNGVTTADGDAFTGEAVILATGHSARDIFHLLYNNNLHIEAKPFALGVRAEHPQSLIDAAQYKCASRGEWLPPASYSLVQQVGDHGVFSFCMCPGGIIAPAATDQNEIVVNGWSPSKRNNPYANSGIVVQVEEKDVKALPAFKKEYGSTFNSPLFLLYFQQWVEQLAFTAGGGQLVAPAQRMVDFCEGTLSQTLPGCSYLPGLHAAPLWEVLPSFVSKSLQQGFKLFGTKIKGYYTNEAVIVATESRTSSPVRIPRDKETLEHPQLRNFYPCGEGAGYAGGIVSAAMDGERVAKMICLKSGIER
ncbi:NAD(P)/FAD-dependent oxidoreductase [Niabella beijingensis]|uniref:NAD(P)/FAD-dependent oxidoreductase n=1 Tax=Niabella beijingensis TaxID=2872700 RepID=UPI001CBEA54E|nr:NAD(P)/FAD-dependent oxidoreductase [Niabella beijingensis]MBZ4190074.1 NAD(P)/FAD-dependent oxidoreductase [Niabella beijingensis]